MTTAAAQKLATDVAGEGPRLVLVHGFTQNRSCWGPIATDLARDHELVLVDAPGHGGSSDVTATLEDGARLITDAGGAGTYLGYSMGGRYVLRAALDRPGSVERLVLVSASPGLEVPAERATRRRADEALADHVTQLGLQAFLDEWLARPIFVGLPPSMRMTRERLTNDAAGLATSLRLAGTGAQEPMWDRLGELAMPVLLVTGSSDAKFTAVADRMKVAIGANATQVVVPNAGHTAHLEKPDGFLSALRAWLRSTSSS